MKKPQMRLEDWSLVEIDDPYKAPEQRTPKLRGKVYGNPRFEDGIYIITSRLMYLTKKDVAVTHSGSRYKLGVIDSEYGKLYPKALERLYKSFKRYHKGETK